MNFLGFFSQLLIYYIWYHTEGSMQHNSAHEMKSKWMTQCVCVLQPTGSVLDFEVRHSGPNRVITTSQDARRLSGACVPGEFCVKIAAVSLNKKSNPLGLNNMKDEKSPFKSPSPFRLVQGGPKHRRNMLSWG